MRSLPETKTKEIVKGLLRSLSDAIMQGEADGAFGRTVTWRKRTQIFHTAGNIFEREFVGIDAAKERFDGFCRLFITGDRSRFAYAGATISGGQFHNNTAAGIGAARSSYFPKMSKPQIQALERQFHGGIENDLEVQSNQSSHA